MLSPIRIVVAQDRLAQLKTLVQLGQVQQVKTSGFIFHSPDRNCLGSQPYFESRMAPGLLEVPSQGREILSSKDGVDVQQRLSIFERRVPLEADYLQLFVEFPILVGLSVCVPIGEPYPLHRPGSAHVGKVNALRAEEISQLLDDRFPLFEANDVPILKLLKPLVALS